MNQNTQVPELLQLAEQACIKNNARLTQKRRQVLTLLLHLNKAISAYELIELFKTSFSETLPPMTVYRALEFLEKMQLAHRLNTENKYIACSHIGCESSHELPHFLICQRCLRVDELNNDTVHSLCELTNRVEQTGYQLSSPQIELNGICDKCLLSDNSD